MDERMGLDTGLAAGRAVLADAVGVLAAVPGLLWQASGPDLADLMTELDRVAALAGAGRVAVTVEALARGEIDRSQSAGTSAWVAAHAPSLGVGGAGQVGRFVEATRRPCLTPIRDAVIAGDLAVPVAAVVSTEFLKLWDRVVPEAREAVLAGLITVGVSDGARGVRSLRDRLLAQFGDPGERERAAERAAREVALSQAQVTDDEGVWEYVLRVDAEAKAILEAAIGPLSAPMHTEDTKDLRSTAQRRGQALVEVCRRVDAGVSGGLCKREGPDVEGDSL